MMEFMEQIQFIILKWHGGFGAKERRKRELKFYKFEILIKSFFVLSIIFDPWATTF